MDGETKERWERSAAAKLLGEKILYAAETMTRAGEAMAEASEQMRRFAQYWERTKEKEQPPAEREN